MIHLFIFDVLFIIINYLIYIFYKFLHLSQISSRFHTSKRLPTLSFQPPFTILYLPTLYLPTTWRVHWPYPVHRGLSRVQNTCVKLISNHVSKPRNASGYPASALFIAWPTGANLINRSNMDGGTFGLRKRTLRVYTIFPFFFFLVFQGHRHNDTRIRLKTASASIPQESFESGAMEDSARVNVINRGESRVLPRGWHA